MASSLSRSELIAALSAKPFWDPGEFAALQQRVGGADALEGLIDLLQNYADPPDQLNFGFRDTMVRLLGEIGDPRALVPLLQCYELYNALPILLVQALTEKGVVVPESLYEQDLVALYKSAGSPPLRETAGYRAFEQRVSNTHMKSQLGTEQYTLRLLGFGWLTRVNVIRALSKMKADGMNDLLANLLSQERGKSARESLVLALGERRDPRAIEGLGEYLIEFTSASSYITEEPKAVINHLAAYPDERAKELLKQFWEKCTEVGKRAYRNQAAAHLGLPVDKSTCFIATAAYGTDAMPQVVALRQFRDERLAPHGLGRKLVALYERLSPPLAAFIRDRPAWRQLVKIAVLDHLVRFLQWAGVVELQRSSRRGRNAR